MKKKLCVSAERSLLTVITVWGQEEDVASVHATLTRMKHVKVREAAETYLIDE